jgi:hypothetical protein
MQAGTVIAGTGVAMIWRAFFEGMEEKRYIGWVFGLLALSSILDIIGHKVF